MFDTNFLLLVAGKAFTLFMVLDPPGCVGPVTTLLSGYDFKTQQRILRREVLIALVAMLLFYIGGSYFLRALDIQQASVEITGGIVFGFVAISILFPRAQAEDSSAQRSEPFVVPIAVPLIAGPSCLATIILFSNDESAVLATVLSIVVGWAGAALIVLLAPFLAKILGKTGLKVSEQIIGVICIFVAMQMILGGVGRFISHQH